MKKKLFCSSLLILVAYLCYGQSKLTGFVCDSLHKAVPDVNVLLFQNDSIVAGVSTNTKGNFSLELKSGEYILHITHLGYAERIDTIVLRPEGLTLSAIVLKEGNIELSEVIVKGERPMYESQLNKDIYNIPSQVKKNASDVYQILANVPSLTVDPVTRTIRQLAGAENFIVMVNNIRRGGDYLLLLKPEDIDKVEIKRFPGMRYKGVDAIINIVTKAPMAGQSVRLYGQLNPLLKTGSTNGSYIYNAGKISASLSASTDFTEENKGELYSIRDAIVNGATIHTAQHTIGKTPNNSNNGGISANFDYTPSVNTFASLSVRYNAAQGRTYRPFTGCVSVDGKSSYDFESSQDTHYNNNTLVFNPYFQTNVSKNFQISTEAKYQTYISKTNKINSQITSLQDSSLVNQMQNGNRQSFEGQVNFSQQLNKIQLEEGYRVFWQKNVMDARTNKYSEQTTQNDLRNFAYINVLGSINKKWVYQAGIGFDATNVHVNSALQDKRQQLTPNAMLRYNINKSQNITLDYTLMRQSPGSASMLNSTPIYGIDSAHITVGNPDLKPYYINRLALSYNLGVKQKFFTYLSLRRQLANNYIVQKRYLDDNGVYITTWVNAERYSSSSLIANFTFKFVDWLNVGINSSVEYYDFKDNYQPLNKNFRKTSLAFNSSFTFRKMSLFLYYNPQWRQKTLTGYARDNDFSSLFFSYSLNKSWMFQFGIRYLTASTSKYEMYAIDYSEINRYSERDRHMIFLVGFNYNFQKGLQKNSKQKKVKQYDDNVY